MKCKPDLSPSNILAFKLLIASIMLASGSCLGKIRSCKNSDGGSSAKREGLHCASCWGCRVAPKCILWDCRNIRTLYIKLLTEMTWIKWSSSEPVTAEGLQWPARVVVWPSSGCTCSGFLWSDLHMLPHTSLSRRQKSGTATSPSGHCFYSLGVITLLYLLRFLFWLGL